MKTALLLVCLVSTAPAFAAEENKTVATDGDTAVTAETLDLSLPQSTTYRNDPPGTWYGDTSGVPATMAETSRNTSGCPTSPDGKETDLTGSVGMGFGYSSHGGNLNYQTARLNYCKEYASDDGDSRRFNVDISVSNFDGPDFRYGQRSPPSRPGH